MSCCLSTVTLRVTAAGEAAARLSRVFLAPPSFAGRDQAGNASTTGPALQSLVRTSQPSQTRARFLTDWK